MIEEWRGRLGAGSRLTDKQLPVLLAKSRYAERLPIGTPEILKSFPRQRLRRLLSPLVSPGSDGRRRRRRHRSGRGAEAGRAAVRRDPGGQDAARAVDRTVPPHKETLFTIATDPEAQGWSVALAHKRPSKSKATVGDYRRSLDPAARHADAQSAAARDCAAAERAVSRRRGRAGRASADRSRCTSSAPRSRRAASPPASRRSSSRRAGCSSSGSPPTSSIAPARRCSPSFERAYKERDTSESPSYAERVRPRVPRARADSRASSSNTRSRRRFCRPSRSPR